MSPPPNLDLRCFGPPTARLDGQEAPAEVLWRKNLALLIYLALSPSRMRTREHLRGLLWPEKDEDYARRSLNEAVRRLRRCLGEERLQSNGDSIEISDAGLTIDALPFFAPPSPGMVDPTPQGEFLEGFTVVGCHAFEEWVSRERERISQRATTLLVEAGERALAASRLAEAADAGQRALRIHPLSEPAARLVMRAAALAGDSAGALSAFHSFAQRLQDAIAERPPRELAALSERIRRRTWRPSGGSQLEDEIPLVGRDEECREVFATIAEGTTRGSRTILITGAPGMGRTRMLGECSARMALEGAALASARPLPDDSDIRWSTLRLLVRGGLGQMPGLAGAAPEALAVLADIAPNLPIRGVPLAARDTAHVVAALSEALNSAAEEQPVGIVIDDAHFADGATLGALLAVFQQLKDAHMLLLLTVPEQLEHPSADLLRLRQEITRGLPGVAVGLQPLALDDVRALVGHLAPWCQGDDQRDRLARRIARECSGSPFLAVTLLHALKRPHSLREDLLNWPPPDRTHESQWPTPVPDVIGVAISTRLVEVSPATQRILAAASIGGPAFDLELIASLTEHTRDTIEEMLAGAERRHLVIFDGERYAFAAPIVAEVVRRECLTAGQRQSLNRRAATFLETRQDLDSKVLRAELLSRVEPGVGAFEHALEVAGVALANGAERAGKRALAAAEKAAGQTPSPEQRARVAELRTEMVKRVVA